MGTLQVSGQNCSSFSPPLRTIPHQTHRFNIASRQTDRLGQHAELIISNSLYKSEREVKGDQRYLCLSRPTVDLEGTVTPLALEVAGP